MSFLKSLFGLGKTPEAAGQPTGGKAAKAAEYKGYVIEARPYPAGGQYQLAGTIARMVEGTRKEFPFVRADRFTSMEEAAEFALVKGRQIIDERGEKVFE